jgi:hypothetical protein
MSPAAAFRGHCAQSYEGDRGARFTRGVSTGEAILPSMVEETYGVERIDSPILPDAAQFISWCALIAAKRTSNNFAGRNKARLPVGGFLGGPVGLSELRIGRWRAFAVQR